MAIRATPCLLATIAGENQSDLESSCLDPAQATTGTLPRAQTIEPARRDASGKMIVIFEGVDIVAGECLRIGCVFLAEAGFGFAACLGQRLEKIVARVEFTRKDEGAEDLAQVPFRQHDALHGSNGQAQQQYLQFSMPGRPVRCDRSSSGTMRVPIFFDATARMIETAVPSQFDPCAM
jgi:hypothetical protein